MFVKKSHLSPCPLSFFPISGNYIIAEAKPLENAKSLCFLFRKLYIADARPRKNALANVAMGGGSESSSNYFQSEVCQRFELSNYVSHSHQLCCLIFTNIIFLFFICYQVVFFGIDNIHSMRESLSRLRDYLDAHGTTSSDGTLSLLVSL